MKGWLSKKLGEVTKFTNGGAWKPEEYVKSGIPVVRVSDIQNETINLEQCKYLSPESLFNYKKHTLFEGDLVIATVGSHPTQPGSVVGRPGIVPRYVQGALLNQNAVRIEPANSCLDKKYLGYLGKSQFFRNYVIQCARGSANQVRMSIGLLKEMQVLLPSLSTQQKIAAILSNYDRLIENNTRRIEILEEMARSLYDEWFIKFRFPGNEQTKMVDSELGLVPEGWEVGKLRKVSSYINRGISPKYDDQSTSIVINQKCIRDSRLNLDLVRRHSKKFSQEKLIRFGDVLVNSTGVGTLGRVAQVYQNIPECTVDSHVSIVRPAEDIDIDYFGCSLFRLQSYFDHSGVGSTGQTELSRESIGNAEFLLSPKEIQQAFGQAVSPMRRKIIDLFAKNSNLRKTRDLLLPKLISGEIDVENLDIDNKERITET